jgi:hypothetical protein
MINVPGLAVVGESPHVAEAHDHQRDDGGEQLHRHQGAQHAAVDLVEPGDDCGDGSQMPRLSQSSVARFQPRRAW